MRDQIDVERLARALELVLAAATPTVTDWERVAKVIVAAYETEATDEPR